MESLDVHVRGTIRVGNRTASVCDGKFGGGRGGGAHHAAVEGVGGGGALVLDPGVLQGLVGSQARTRLTHQQPLQICLHCQAECHTSKDFGFSAYLLLGVISCSVALLAAMRRHAHQVSVNAI